MKRARRAHYLLAPKKSDASQLIYARTFSRSSACSKRYVRPGECHVCRAPNACSPQWSIHALQGVTLCVRVIHPRVPVRPHNALVCWLAAIILEEKRFLQKRPNLSRAPNFSFFRASVLLCAPAQWTVTCFEVSKICVWWMRRMECVWVLWALKGPSTTRLLY